MRAKRRWTETFSQLRVSGIAPEGLTTPDQPGRTRVVASSWETMAGPAMKSPAPSAGAWEKERTAAERTPFQEVALKLLS
jgi:hypothetical protein